MEIGNQVRVIHTGASYTTYDSMAKYMKFTRWDFKKIPSKERTYKIIAMARHGEEIHSLIYNDKERIIFGSALDKRTMICGIQDIENGNQYMIGIHGLEVCPVYTFTMEDFEI